MGRLRIRLTYKDWLLLCFLLGILWGTAAAHFFGESAGGLRELTGYRASDRSWETYFYVCRARFAQLAVGWLMGLAVCSAPLFGAAAAYTGMTLAVVLSALTEQKGILGLPVFLCAVGPQGIFYGAVWAVLAMWAGDPAKRTRLGPLALLGLLAAAGAFAEVYISPLAAGWAL